MLELEESMVSYVLGTYYRGMQRKYFCQLAWLMYGNRMINSSLLLVFEKLITAAYGTIGVWPIVCFFFSVLKKLIKSSNVDPIQR